MYYIYIYIYVKGGGHGKFQADFIGQIFSVETHDNIFKIFGIYYGGKVS